MWPIISFLEYTDQHVEAIRLFILSLVCKYSKYYLLNLSGLLFRNEEVLWATLGILDFAYQLWTFDG